MSPSAVVPVPRRMLRGLGRLAGGLAANVAAGRRSATERCAEALGLDRAEAGRRVRRAWSEVGATVGDALAGGEDPRRFCRRLTLADWHHLDDAEQGAQGLLLPIAPFGAWPDALRALLLYRGPLTVTGTPAYPLGRRLALADTCGLDHRAAARHLAAGGRLALPLLADAGDDAVEVPWLGGFLPLSGRLCRLATTSGAPAVLVLARPDGPSRRRALALAPVLAGGDDEGFARTLGDLLGEAVGRHPELWPWGLT